MNLSTNTQKKILVSDFHIGLNQAQVATLKKTGAICKLLTMSGSVGLTNVKSDLSYNEQKVIKQIKELFFLGAEKSWFGRSWTPAKTQALFQVVGEKIMAEVFAEYDAYLVSFPPSLAHLFLYLAEKYDKQLILNLGHRFNIGVKTREENEAMLSLLNYLQHSSRHILASGSEYDCQYVKYYLGFEPQKLPIICHHLELNKPSPELETILIGPVNFQLKQAETRLNAIAQNWCQKNNRKPIHFSLIRTLYKKYDRYEELARYMAVVIMPYSAYSISMLELYELNIPFFVPAPKLLIREGFLSDRALVPIYCDRKQYAEILGDRDSDTSYSPNSYEANAQLYWLQFCFFYQTRNAIVWESPEDLLEKIASTNFDEVRAKMYRENKERREAGLQKWREILGASQF